MAQDTISWLDPYARTNDKELQAHATCVVDGRGYRVAQSGKTYCLGLLKEKEDTDTITTIDAKGLGSLSPQHSSNCVEKPKKAVTKVSPKGIVPPLQTTRGLMLHKKGIGRPLKEGPVTRMTEHRRRKKATQGALL